MGVELCRFVSCCDWLISLSVMSSRFISVGACDRTFCLLETEFDSIIGWTTFCYLLGVLSCFSCGEQLFYEHRCTHFHFLLNFFFLYKVHRSSRCSSKNVFILWDLGELPATGFFFITRPFQWTELGDSKFLRHKILLELNSFTSNSNLGLYTLLD